MANGEKKTVVHDEVRHEEGDVCMMCNVHRHMHGREACSVCGGMNHYFLLRVLLGLLIIGFVFWAGIAVGCLISNNAWEHDRGFGYDEFGPYGEMHGMIRAHAPVGSNVMYYGSPGMKIQKIEGSAIPTDATVITPANAENFNFKALPPVE